MKVLVAASATSDDPADPVTAAAAFPWPADTEIRVLSVAEVVRPVMVGMSPDAVDLTDVHVISKADAQSSVERAAGRLRARGFRAEGLAVEGSPETEIIEYAGWWGADVIVVGSHDRSLLERLLLSSVSQGVVKHAPCSVLVVKHKAVE
jgi:nucleotide-binding universal stress UspA family protein